MDNSESPPELRSSFTFPSPQVKIDPADTDDDYQPRPLVHHLSEPTETKRFSSPLRHHKRTPSMHREVKETLDAQTEFGNEDADGRSHHRVNQYTILEEVGRGSYGAVHLATDQFGQEFAVKEFSKSRLRKRAQSHILRQGPRGPRPRGIRPSLGGPLGGPMEVKNKDALYLIREEIAIMKKLNHPNLVQLIEVLDDPEEDSMYMVLEMCKRGVVMKVGLDEQADPYPEETCRCWFRDLILGIEYLHAQGVIHRDIKPDNLLLSDDDVLKIVDFGVSEMFEKPGEMRVAKSAGSPAFMPPELCGRHGDVSGKAADIWSMGVSLYCLKYGRIPFNRDGLMDMYDAIKADEPQMPEDENPDFVDLMNKILEKDPEKRIKMEDLREHPWVTHHGQDPLLSAEENCAYMVEAPNELELSRALTMKINHLLCVMKAISRFKGLRKNKESRVTGSSGTSTQGQDVFDPKEEKAKAEVIERLLAQRRKIQNNKEESGKGHAQDVSEQEPLFLGIGTGARDDFAMDKATPDVVSDSPTAVDFNVYDRAYETAIEKITAAQKSSRKPTMYLTKFVNEKEHFKKLDNVVEGSTTPMSEPSQDQQPTSPPGILTKLASKIGLAEAPQEEHPEIKKK